MDAQTHVSIWPEPGDITITQHPGGDWVCRIGFVTIDRDLDAQESLALEWLHKVRRAKAQQDHETRARFVMTRPKAAS